jgi:hypothetical protein
MRRRRWLDILIVLALLAGALRVIATPMQTVHAASLLQVASCESGTITEGGVQICDENGWHDVVRKGGSDDRGIPVYYTGSFWPWWSSVPINYRVDGFLTTKTTWVWIWDGLNSRLSQVTTLKFVQ